MHCASHENWLGATPLYDLCSPVGACKVTHYTQRPLIR